MYFVVIDFNHMTHKERVNYFSDEKVGTRCYQYFYLNDKF